MDRLIATNSVNLAGADAPPVGGVAQYATDGNPGLNIPATRWPAYQYNAIQEEIISVISKAGIALDRTKQNQLLSAIQKLGRIKITGDTTFYVSAAGSDANDGLTVGTPWLTIQHAVNVISQAYDFNGFIITVSIGAGTFAGFSLTAPLVGATGVGSLIFNGASAATTLLSSTVLVVNAAVCTINGLTFVGGGISSLLVGSFSSVYIATGSPVTFPANIGGIHLNAGNCGIITINGNYNISGGASNHLSAIGLSNIIFLAGTCTLTGTPAFAAGFAFATMSGLIQSGGGVAYAGAATGIRYSATLNGVMNTGGGGANYFPGNSAGSTATGGQYQ